MLAGLGRTVDNLMKISGLRLPLGEGNGTPLQYSCLENPMDGGAWWVAVHGVAKSRTRLSDLTSTFHFHALEKEMIFSVWSHFSGIYSCKFMDTFKTSDTDVSGVKGKYSLQYG